MAQTSISIYTGGLQQRSRTTAPGLADIDINTGHVSFGVRRGPRPARRKVNYLKKLSALLAGVGAKKWRPRKAGAHSKFSNPMSIAHSWALLALLPVHG